MTAWRQLTGIAAMVGLLGGAAGLRAAACIGDRFDSVHFNSGQPDFGSAPRRGVIPWRGEPEVRRLSAGWDGPGNVSAELTEARDFEVERAQQRARGRALRSARACERRRDWAGAIERYRELARRTGWGSGLRDRVEVLQAAHAGASPAPPRAAVEAYARGMALVDAGRLREASAVFLLLSGDHRAGMVRDHAGYQLACAAAQVPGGSPASAIAAFDRILVDPLSPALRERTLLMKARTAILNARKGDPLLHAGSLALDQLQREFPQSRFRRAAAGLRARVCLLGGQPVDAARMYLALGDHDSLATARLAMVPADRRRVDVPLLALVLKRVLRASTFREYSNRVSQIDRLSAGLNAAQARDFRARIDRDLQLASAYLYFRVYHDRARMRADGDSRRVAPDLSGLLKIASRLAAAHATLPPDVMLRIAELNYEAHRYRAGLAWADRALRAHRTPRALYVRGASLHRLGQLAASVASFQAVVARYPHDSHSLRARENIAVIREEQGRYGDALLQYFALSYDTDVAYLLDVRMSVAEIERVLAGQSTGRNRPLVQYALAMRLMRNEQWDAARRAFQAVPRADYRRFTARRRELYEPPAPAAASAADPLACIARLSAASAADPLDCIARLSAAQQRARRPGSDRERATALYRFATAYYGAHSLLLYNASLWRGGREFSFDFYWNPRAANHADRAAVRAHMYAHERYARAIPIDLALVARYPHSPEAPRALYQAACAYWHLADFNQWWRGEDTRERLLLKASRLMRKVARGYPRSDLAKSARKYARVFAADYRANLERAGERHW